MRRSSWWMCQLGWIGVLVAAGCNSADGHRVTMPWQKPMAKEEFHVPAMADARFSEPATLPRNLMQAGIKPKAEGDPRRPPTAGAGNPGMMTSGRPGGMGGY